jgi:heat-inducible transcriptional repressor
MELTARQEQILKSIVEQYIDTAHPVGSAAIVASSGLAVSSATVRNDVAVLEECGYVRQLHTSGGRVPTDTGYRYYVEHLMHASRLPSSDVTTIRHQFHQAHSEMQEWMKLAATVMAHRMRNVGLVTAPRSTEARLRHLEVISIHDSVALLIVVLHDGTVLQEMISLPEPLTQEALSSGADHLNRALRGSTAAEIDAVVATLAGLEGTVAEMVSHLIRRGEGQQAQVFHAGLSDMIRQPEFSDVRPGTPAAMLSERLSVMLEFLQQGFAVQRLLTGLPQEADVHIVIGGTSASEALSGYSFVLGRYGDDADTTGYLGVVGPTRMEYPRAVALVRYMTHLMTDLLSTY